jgi:exopolysaccharide biosynthesis polyprenyl glycosylphosphotransferase
MHRRRGEAIFFLLPILSDGVFILVSFTLAYWLRFYSGLIGQIKSIPLFSYYAATSFFVAAVWIVVFYLSGLYDTKRNYSLVDEIYEILKSALIGTFVALAPAFFFRGFSFSRLVFVIACILSVLFVILGRLGLRWLRAIGNKKGFYLKRIAIVGGGEMGQAIRDRISRNPSLGYTIIGQVMEDSNPRIDGLRILGNIGEITEIVKKENLDSLIMTFPLHKHHQVVEILNNCKDLKLDYHFVPDLYEMMTSKVTYTEIDGIPLMGFKEFPLDNWLHRVCKRVLDIFLSFVFLVLFSPIYFIISTIIKLTSKGPVFYRQERIGQDGTKFEMLKFRSMKANAEDGTGPVFAGKEDPRRTKIGKTLRKSSLDELPQLFNVLKGEMSLVGPRPERPHFVEKYECQIPRYVERHKVKSGMTGWAQVNGFRGNTSIEERIKHDTYYIENWSLGFDVKILMRTFFEVFNSKTAY